MSRRPAGALLNLVLETDDGPPLHRQIYEGIRQAILAGRLVRGTRLASTRSTAADLAVSRATVVSAFAQLMAEGYLVGHVGSGTHVSHALPDDLTMVRTPRETKTRIAARPTRRDAGRFDVIVQGRPSGFARPLWPANPSVHAFPLDDWTRILSKHWRSATPSQLQYGDPLGDRRLRDAIGAYVSRARGVRVDGKQVMIVSGAQQAFFLCAQLLLDSRDVFWMEEPGYPLARRALATTGARVVPVPVDTQGVIVAAGRRREPTPRLVYVTPSHQCPTGAAMSAARRLELLELVAATNAWIVEDDYDSEYRFLNRPLPALQSLDRSDRVIYVGSLSKTLLPCLRVGFLVLPTALVEPFARTRALIDRHAPTIEQAALAEFVEVGLFERHIRRMRALYLERRDVLMQAIRTELAGTVDISETDAGLYVVAWLRSGLDETAVVSAAAEHGVDALPVSAFYHRAPRHGGLVLGFGAYSPPRIRESVKRLAKAIQTVGRG